MSLLRVSTRCSHHSALLLVALTQSKTGRRQIVWTEFQTAVGSRQHHRSTRLPVAIHSAALVSRTVASLQMHTRTGGSLDRTMPPSFRDTRSQKFYPTGSASIRFHRAQRLRLIAEHPSIAARLNQLSSNSSAVADLTVFNMRLKGQQACGESSHRAKTRLVRSSYRRSSRSRSFRNPPRTTNTKAPSTFQPLISQLGQRPWLTRPPTTRRP